MKGRGKTDGMSTVIFGGKITVVVGLDVKLVEREVDTPAKI